MTNCEEGTTPGAQARGGYVHNVEIVGLLIIVVNDQFFAGFVVEFCDT
jgi:hypothetical protein